ncbi:GGDEF domain-containing protein [Halomonas lysinitropha]|uniref:diguanylate cyclase n=1 Tax=Halomonas lysinitropha TaxID=2607506 RepID=A0A5K1HZG7_9GAMM|nr:GGDEF domain-containing protein [Halomonas lysinitropha]VVZ94984.1 putative diguanylate cyclase AdrA [Halomonas lysinitropha]
MSDQDPLPPLEWDPQGVQIQGFSAGLYQIEWLLVTVVILYLVIIGLPDEGALGVLAATFGYFIFSLLASRLRFFGERQRWLLALHTWAMIGFITWFLYSTDGVTGPLASLYLLAVVTSALTLGVVVTMLEVAAIAACQLLLLHLLGTELLTTANLAPVGTSIIALLIVGYLTASLVHAIHVSNRTLLKMASRDSLTGLYNRRAFDDLARPIHEMARRSGRPYCLITMDMDGLKRINDTDGHGAGDQAILGLTEWLQACKRSSDVLARYGGDEFVMLLPETNASGGKHMMERLIDAVKDDKLSISVGIASYPEQGGSLEELFGHADSAMYVSKASGGNRVSIQSVA